MTKAPRRELKIDAVDCGLAHLIEANAGTGKTYAIANLFLRFVLEGRGVQEVLVVTFTRAATDELRGRVRRRLAAARAMLRSGRAAVDEDDFFRALPVRYPEGSPRDEALARLELALLEIQDAPIHTIHGFCQQALADQALASGQAFDLEQADDGELKVAALRDWWRRRAYRPDQPGLDELHGCFPGFEAFRQQAEPLLKAPAPKLEPEPPDDLEEERKRVIEALHELAARWRRQGGAARDLLLTHKALSRTKTNGQKPEALEPVLDELDRALSAEEPVLPVLETLARIAPSQIKFTRAGKGREEFDCEPFRQADLLYRRMETFRQLLHVSMLDDARRFARGRVGTAKERLGQLSYDDMIERLHAALGAAEHAPSGGLAKVLADQYPVILVDEFQDTDPLQYGIFSCIHGAEDQHTLIMIGDPKQAVYGFRGGDIFAYLQAVGEADRHWTLSINWRSTPAMIGAVNALFERSEAFVYQEIPYKESGPPPGAERVRPLAVDGDPVPALRVERLPLGEGGKPMNKEDTLHHVHRAVARRIAELLAAGASLGDAPLRPHDIAVLVRTGAEAEAVRRELMDVGIGAVAAGRASIWESGEADGLYQFLKTCLAPSDRGRLRGALGVEFLGLPAGEIHAIVSDPVRWTRWVELVRAAGETWQRRGLLPAFDGLLHSLGDALSGDGGGEGGWLAHLDDPERTLTNLLHLAELLQSASREHGDGERLLAWMRRQREIENPDEYELRLESDTDLVRIVTMHKSKGLQYPVVFAPYLWHCKPATDSRNRTGRWIKWHEKTVANAYRHCFTPWIDEKDPHLVLAERERLAEDVRLAYVALTRAAAHCHLFFGPAQGNAGKSALAWLLGEREPKQEIFGIRDAAIRLTALEGRPGIEILEPCDTGASVSWRPPEEESEIPGVASLERSIRSNWRIGSYSAMTRDVHQATHVVVASARGGDFALNYPAGARVGSFLHALLERLDPSAAIEPQVERLSRNLALRHGVAPDQDMPALADWMEQVLETPLDSGGLTLGSLSPDRALHELSFDLSTGEVDSRQLNDLLESRAGAPLDPLTFDAFQGMVTGVIDLVFEHEGRYCLADYKSNLLGRRLGDYTPDRLRAEIAARRYDLQYLVYTLALHRHLRLRLPDYDYERDFGGVFYLFLRAMRPEQGPRYGVFFTRPEGTLIDRLDREIFASGTEEAA